ncbi:response regulator transcription factor [Burkholderia multivorans]|nr:response regulator transcription factor [Burkholderia multivorans]
MKHLSIRVVLADDHPAVLSGIKYELASHSMVSVVATAKNAAELFDALNTHPCDVLVSDYSMPCATYGDGLTLFKLLRDRHPDVKIVVLTMVENPVILRWLSELGIHCIVSKADITNHLTMAIHAAYTNGRYLSPSMDKAISMVATSGKNGALRDLSPREVEVVRYFVSGMTVNEIAARLNRSKKTVSTHKARAMQKLGIRRDVDLVRYGIDTGLPISGITIQPGSEDVL